LHHSTWWMGKFDICLLIETSWCVKIVLKHSH
jgi:hypothetical protein